MSIKTERKFFCKCDFCDNEHTAREANSYTARVKAGVDGWAYVNEGGKGGPSFDYCPTCHKGAQADVKLLMESEGRAYTVDEIQEDVA